MDMKWTFGLLIKSHCSFPDFEAECEAESKINAARLFKKQYKTSLREYTWQDLLPFIDLIKT